ncbi:hypothetical protein GPROT1_00276 [Gammaproteobacteria bacterium]|nr:hypothetical protein GPROT1_00276 [Gammaproteobacteria bacterium]
MSNRNLFRIAGFSTFLTLVLYLGGFGVGAANPALVGPFLAVASIVFLVVVYALYVVHRAESSGLAIGAALLTAVGLIVSVLAGDPNTPTNILYAVSAIIFGVGIVLFGWLAYNSAKMPRGLAIAALVAGALSLSAGFFDLGGNGLLDVANLLNFGSIIPFFVWMIWLGRLFLTGKLTTA